MSGKQIAGFSMILPQFLLYPVNGFRAFGPFHFELPTQATQIIGCPLVVTVDSERPCHYTIVRQFVVIFLALGRNKKSMAYMKWVGFCCGLSEARHGLPKTAPVMVSIFSVPSGVADDSSVVFFKRV